MISPPVLESEQLETFWTALRRRVRGHVHNDRYNRILYSTDASIYQVEPLGVFFPRDADDLQAAMTIAYEHRVPVLMRGAGTALAGQTVNKALVIDTSRFMTSVLEINPEERWVRVEPGVVLDHLNTQLAAHGLQFGPDPASSNRATLGGIISNNATGSHSIVYGMSVDHVRETTAILSDGSQAHFGPLPAADLSIYGRRSGLEGQIYRDLGALLTKHKPAIDAVYQYHWRRCGGYNLDHFINTDTYNLAKLLCGAEGTLAGLSEIKLGLVPVPAYKGLGVIHFNATHDALRAVPEVLETGPSAVEIMDELALTMCREVRTYARLLTFLEGYPKAILITEYTGESPAEVQDKLSHLEQFLRQRGLGTACVRAETPQQQAQVWQVRKVGLGLLMSVKGDYKPVAFIEDSAVPVHHLYEYVTRLEQVCAELDVRMPYYAHASAGCVHIRPMLNMKDAADIGKMEAISQAAFDMVKAYGGAWSSEHGDGRSRSYLNEIFFGPQVYQAFQQLKQSFDAHNLLNPGNIVNAGPMAENLRYGGNYQTIPLHEHLDFSADQGFHRAIEMCNGAGVCRKDGGTMCPSYMVTRDEEHSTRGRANLLRAALSGRLPQEELTSERMFEAMDLCIECKACQSECPSSVDMAKIKFEFLAHYYEKHPVPWRTRLFGSIPQLSRLSSGPLAPLANASLVNPVLRWGMARFLGITAERSLPRFAEQPFTTWFRRRRHRFGRRDNGRRVVLFNDTFNTYNDPEIAQAAVEVLEAAGFRVQLSEHGCCGRPAISKGLFNEAKAAAAATVARLDAVAAEGLPIIGLEPSCILSLRDEYLALLPDSAAARRVAAQAVTIEEFLAEQLDDPNFSLPLDGQARRVLLHGHCHQKAIVGTEPARRLLSLLGPVEEIDSGCCGMAGSFGYEAEHYDTSLAMAERALLPAVRAADANTLVVAAGTSCRHQIADGSGRTALHPVQALHLALTVEPESTPANPG